MAQLKYVHPRCSGVSVLLLVTCLASGCTFSHYLSRTAVDYNRSIESSSNALILMNILRARDHQPLYFSSISVLRGSISASVGGTVTIPFGGAAITDVYSADPTVSVAVNPTSDIVPLNTQEFMRALMTETTFDTFSYFWNHGWDPTMLLNVLVAKLTTNGVDIVNNPEDPEGFKAFQLFVACAVAKKFQPTVRSSLEEFGPAIPFKFNEKNPDSATELVKGLVALVSASDAGLTVEWSPKNETYQLKQTVDEPVFGGSEGCDLGTVRSKRVVGLRSLTLSPTPPFGTPFGGKDPKQGERAKVHRSNGKGEQRKPEVTFQLRSTDAVLHYLGAVARKKEPQIFQLHDGAKLGGAESVGVWYKGRAFHVLTTDEPTMQTLSLVAQLLAINTSASALPTTPAVIRVGPPGP